MMFPTEVWRLIFSKIDEDRDKDEFRPNKDLVTLAYVSKTFCTLSQECLYGRAYLAASEFQPSGYTFTLFATTLSNHPDLAKMVRVIYAGTLPKCPAYDGHMLGSIILLAPNLHTLDIHGWQRDDFHDVLRCLLTKDNLRTLTLDRYQLQTGPVASSDTLCDLSSFLSYMRYLPQLEAVNLLHGACRTSSPRGINNSWTVPGHTLQQMQSIGYQAHIRDLMERLHRSEFQFLIIDELTAQVYLNGVEQTPVPFCPRLRHFSCNDAMSSDSQLRLLSEIAPHLRELSLRSEVCSFTTAHKPSTFIAPALSIWSPNLVKLVLPDYEDSFMGYYMNPLPDGETFYGEDSALVNAITQMPSLRILGIPRDFIAPEHFRRGPNSLVSLDYYMSKHFLPSFAAVLHDSEVLPCLRRLCLSNGRLRIGTEPIDAVIETRRIEFHRHAWDWEEASDALDL